MSSPLVPPLLQDLPGSPTLHDSHAEAITNQSVVDADTAVRSFFESAPGWLDVLMRARHALVGRFGFKTPDRERHQLPSRFDVGHKIGMFEVLTRSDDEVVLGGVDTHFSVHISLWVPAAAGVLHVTTIAHHHDLAGRIYLAVIRGPHRLLAPVVTQRTVRRRPERRAT